MKARRIVLFAALLAGAASVLCFSSPARAQNMYFDVNGATAGFGSPTLGGTYSGNYWTTSSAGTTATVGYSNNSVLTFGAVSTDLANSTFTVNIGGYSAIAGFAINSASANVTFIGGGNPYISGTQNWFVAAGSTLTDNSTGLNNIAFNFNQTTLTLTGGGTYNFDTTLGYNSGHLITQTGPVVNLQPATSGNEGSGGYTLTSGTLNFANANAFSSLTSGPLTISGGVIDNTTGSSGTLSSISSTSIAGNFAFNGSNPLNLGTAAVTLSNNPTITVNSTTNPLTIGGAIGGAAQSLTLAGAGTLILGGANTFSGTTTVTGGTLQMNNALALQDSTVALSAVGNGINLNGYNPTFGGITGGGSFNMGSSTLTVGGGGASSAYSGVLSDGGLGGTLVKNGAGTLALSGSNTYLGGTTISAGVLQLGNGGATGSLSTSSSIVDNGTLAFNRNNIVTQGTDFSGSPITGSGGVAQNGTGTLVLNANNIYTGTTNASAGTLSVAAGGSLANSSIVEATGTGVLTISGSVTVAPNGAFAAASGGGAYGTVVVNSGAVLNIGGGSGGYAGRTYIGGYLDAGGTSGNGVFTINGGVVNVAVGGTGTSGDATCLWLNPWGGSGSAVLNLNGGTLSTARLIQDGAGKAGPVNFNGGVLQAAANNMTLFNLVTANVDAGGAIIDTNGYTASINQAFVHGGGSPDGGLTKIGAGVLSLTANSTYNGGTTVNGGTLNLGANGGTGTIRGTLTINPGATVNTTVSNAFGYTGSANEVTTVNINAATLNLAGNGNETACCAINLTGGTISSNGSSSFLDAGYTNGGASSATSFTTNGSTATSLISSNVRLRGDSTPNINFTVASGTAAGGVDLLVSGVISSLNTAGITKLGPGVMELAGSNTYTGVTTLSSGGLDINNNGALSSGAFTISGGTIDNTSGIGITLSNNNTQNWNGDFTFIGTNNLNLGTGAVTMNASRNLTINGGTLTVGGAIAGTGFGLTQNGAGTLVLNGANTFSGNTLISGGTLQLGNALALQNSTLNTGAGTLIFPGVNSLTLGGLQGSANLTLANSNSTAIPLTVGSSGVTTTYSGSFNDNGAGASLTKVGSGTLTLTGSNSYSGGTTISGGGLVFATPSAFPSTPTSNAITLAGGYLGAAGPYTTVNDWLNSGLIAASPTSGGIALTTSSSENINLATAGTGAYAGTFGNLGLGSVGTNTYSGTLTPSGTTYRLGGGGGTLGMANALTNSGGTAQGLVVSGNVVLPGNNTYTGGTTIGPVGSLQIGNGGTGEFLASPTVADSGAIVFNHSNALTYSGVISGNGSLAKQGAGVLTLTAATTYTGATNVAGGTLSVTENQSFGSTSIVIGSGAMFQYNNASGFTQNSITISGSGTLQKLGAGQITFGGGGNVYWDLSPGAVIDVEAGTVVGGSNIQDYWTNNYASLNIASGAVFRGVEANVRIDALTGAGTFTGGYNGAGYTNETIGVANGSGIFSGSMQDQNPMVVVKTGTGIQILTGASTYTGGTTVSAGTLELAGASNRLSTSGAIAVAGGVLDLGGNSQTTSGVVTFSGGTVQDGTIIATGSAYAGQSGTVTANLAGTAGLTKTTAGLLTLGSPTTYTGTTLVSAGTLALGNALALQDSTLDPSGAGTLNLGTFSAITLGGLTNSGALALNNNNAPLALSVGNNGANTTFNGSLSGSGSLTKIGAGALTLSGTNTYSGGTTINAGALIFTSTSATPAGTQNITVNSPGGLGIGGAYPTAASWLASNLISPASNGALSLTASSNENINLSSGGYSNLSLGAVGTQTFSGTIAPSNNTYQLGGGGGTLIVTNSLTDGSSSQGLTINGNVTLATSNTYSGTTTINSGILQVGIGGSSETLGSGPIVDNATLAFNRSDTALNISQAISGSGGVLQNGSGMTTLSAANTYSGATTVTAGTLNIAAGGSLANAGNINAVSGGVLSISGTVNQAANSYFAVGNGLASTTGTTNINSGAVVNLGGNAVLIGGGVPGSGQGSGVLNINGGIVTVGAPSGSGGGADSTYIWINPYGGAATSTLNLNSGTLSTARGIVDGGSGHSLVNFNGGTLQAAANIPALLSVTTADVNAGGAVIDTQGFNVTIANPLLNGGGGGGLTKLGSGMLTLAGNDTFTGTTTVSNGTLQLNGGAFSTTAGTYSIASGAVLSLSLSSLSNADNSGNSEPAVSSGTTTFLGSGTLQLASGWLANGNNNGAPKVIVSLGSGAAINIPAGTGIQNGGWQNITWTNNLASLNVNGTLDLWDGNTVYADALTGSGSIIETGGAGRSLILGVNNGSGVFGGVISNSNGSVALTLSGTGIETFTGANTYSGGTTISAGTLQVGNGGSTGTPGTGYISIANNAVLVFNRSDAGLVVPGAISGSGSVLQVGSGMTTLTNNNSYTGTTTISSGTLQLGNGGGSGSLGSGNVVDNGTLTYNLNAGGTAAPPTGAAISGSGNLNVTAGYMQLNGNITLSGSQSFSEVNAGGLYHGIDLVAANSTLTASSITLNSDIGTNAYQSHSNTLTLDTSAVNGPMNLNFGIGGSGIFYGAGGVTATAGTGTISVTGIGPNNVGWTAPVSLTGAVNITANVPESGVTINTNSTTTGSVSGVLSGGALTKNGPGMLTLSNINTYTGTTTISAGTLDIGNGTTDGSIASSSNIVNNGVLGYNLVGVQSYGNVISGAGALTKNGPGTLMLTGANTYSGPTYINNGVLQISAANNLGNSAVTNTIQMNGGTLESTAGAYDLGTNRAITLGGPATIQSDAGGSLTVSGPVTNGANPLTVAGGGNTVISGAIGSGAGGLTMAGSGTLTLTANNGYAGGTTISSGTVSVGKNSALGTGTVTLAAGANLNIMQATSINGLVGSYYNFANTSDLASLAAFNAALAGKTPALTSNSTAAGANFNFGSTGTGFPAPYNTGTPVFEAQWTGTFNAPLAGSNVYTFTTASDDGSMIWIDGNLVVNNDYSQPITARSGTTVALSQGPHSIVIGYNNTGGGYGFYADIAYAGQATELLPNSLLSTGVAADNSLSIASLSGAAGSTVTLGSGTLTVGSDNSNTTFSGAMSGTGGSLIKIGAGTQTLTGASTYSGGTTINGGMLVVANAAGSATGSGDVYLNSGVLASAPGAADIIGGSVWGGANAHQIAPGGIGSIGSMYIAGGLGLNSNSTLDFDLSGGSAGLLNVGGGLSGSGTATVDLSYANLTSSSYTLATFGGGVALGLTFSGENVPSGYQLNTVGDDLVLSLAGLSAWTNISGGSWNTGSNWTSGSAPSGQGQTALINASAGGPVTITLDTAQTLGTLVLGDSTNNSTAFTLTAGASGSGSLTMANTGSLPASIVVTGGSQTIAANVALAGSLTIAPTVGSTLTISGSVNEITAGTGSLLLADAGTLVLSGSNNFSDMVVTNGTLILTNNEALAGGTSLTIGDASAFAGGPGGAGADTGAVSSGLNAPFAVSPSITPVPEPGTLVLVVAGVVAGLATWRRRRNRSN